jgi:hypothetical protein
MFMFSERLRLNEMQRQITIAANTLKEIKQAEKETEVTINLPDLDSRITRHYESRISQIEADIDLLKSIMEDLKKSS